MVEKATRWNAEAHTNLHAMLRITQAITASTVEDELAQLEDQCPSFRKFADNYGFVFGYSEALQASLNSLMEPLIGEPTAFGYEADENLQKWFFTREGGSQAIPVATESSDQDLANILATINGLMAGCRRAGNRWGNLTKVMRDIQGFTQTVLETLPEYQVTSKQTDVSAAASTSDIIKQRAADWLAGPLWDGRAISNAVEFINPGGSRRPIDIYRDEESVTNILTPLDEDYRLWLPKPRQEHPSQPLGTIAALAFATADLQKGSIGETFPYSLTRDIWTLMQSIKAKLNGFLRYYEHAENQLITPNRIIKISTPELTTPPEPVYSQHRRLGIILGRNRRLVAAANELSYPLVETILHGICSKLLPNSHANVLWIRSMREDNPYTKITIALEMPLIGIISDQTTWWCFYGVAGTGVSDPEIIGSEVRLERLLGRYEQYVKVTDVGPLDDDELIQLLSPHGWNELRAAHKRDVETNAALRAAFSETIATLYLTAQGYSTVRNSMIVNNPKREIDAVGGQHREGENQILVAEVKGRSTQDQGLKESYERFCELVTRLQEEPKDITTLLGLPECPTTVRGIYISLSDAEELGIPQRRDVPLWGFDTLCKELRKARIPSRYIELLRKENIVRLLHLSRDDDWMMFTHDDSDGKPTQ